MLSWRVARLLRGERTLRGRREHLGETRYQQVCAKLEAALNRLLEVEQPDQDSVRPAMLVRQLSGGNRSDWKSQRTWS